MKKIFALTVSKLTNKQHFTYMQLAVAACSIYAIVSEDFAQLVEALTAAFDKENEAFERIDRTFITKRLQGADTERVRLFRHMRDFIKTYETCGEEAKMAAAEILMKIIALYGGGNIPSLKADERTAAICNLVEDFEKEYPEQVEELGCGDMVSALKAANQVYINIVTERAQYDSEFGMRMVATARKQTDAVYHALISSVNAAASVDTKGRFAAYIDYMNVNVRRYRIYIGQSLADMDGTTAGGSASDGSDEGGIVMRNVTFEFVGGNMQKFRMEVGAPLEALPNTLGYKWKPEVPEFVPNRNIIFREVPLDDREVTLTFHFLSHEDEEIRGLVGSLLTAPANTEGCHWEPAVPATFPEDDAVFNEVLNEPSSEDEEENGGNNGGTNTETELTPEEGVTVKWTWNRANVPDGSLVAKEMIVPVESTIPASEWPTAHPGYHWNFTPEELNLNLTGKRAGEWLYIRELPDE